MRNVFGTAEVDHLTDASNRQARLHGAWLIIESGMKHPAVMSALMSADRCLLLQYRDLRFRKTLEQAISGAEANQATANDQVGFFFRHKPARRTPPPHRDSVQNIPGPKSKTQDPRRCFKR